MTNQFRIFGFGSLMWDGWEISFDCISKEKAILRGYRRTFSKPSVKRWGTKEHPGPTLDIEAASDGICEGIAFTFPERQMNTVRAYLNKREGKDFPLRDVSVWIRDGTEVGASVSMYAGSCRLRGTPDEIAQMAAKAVGEAGSCTDYIRFVAKSLHSLGITDAPVTALIAAMDKSS